MPSDWSYSPSGSQLAQVSSDGRFLVWDAASGALAQQFTPASHLAAAVACARWRPKGGAAAEDDTKKKRKRKSSVSLSNGHGAEDPLESLVALGTASGAVLLYSAQFGEVKRAQEGAHSKKVSDLAWTAAGDKVYSCAPDGCIGKLAVNKGGFDKFRPTDAGGKKQKFYSLLLHPSESSVIAGAAASILWIDLDAKVTLRTFGGHVGEVSSLALFMGASGPALVSGGANEKDHALSVWNLDDDKDKEEAGGDGPQPAASLNANEPVVSVEALSRPDHVLIGCVSRSGVFHAFEYDPLSKRKKSKSLRPKVTVQVAQDKDKEQKKGATKVASLPVVAASVRPQQQQEAQVLLSYAAARGPRFDTLDYGTLDKLTCLVRSSSEEAKEDGNNRADGCKYMVPDSAKGVSVVGPASATGKKAAKDGAAAASPAAAGGRKRGISESGGKVEELPMLERLRLLSKEADPVTTPPRTDSMLQLLLQGLHSQDSKLLSSVLDRADEDLIDATVRKLPVEGVAPLVSELQRLLRGRGVVGSSHTHWLRSVLQHHTAYLMSNPKCEQLLTNVHSMLEARTGHYQPLVKLKGKLDLIAKQIQAVADHESDQAADGQINKEAMLVYQDDSSDELSDVMDELLMPASDAEDAWPMGGEEDSDEESEGGSEGSSGSEDEDEEVEMVNGDDDDDEDMDDDDE